MEKASPWSLLRDHRLVSRWSFSRFLQEVGVWKHSHKNFPNLLILPHEHLLLANKALGSAESSSNRTSFCSRGLGLYDLYFSHPILEGVIGPMPKPSFDFSEMEGVNDDPRTNQDASPTPCHGNVQLCLQIQWSSRNFTGFPRIPAWNVDQTRPSSGSCTPE